MVEWVVVKSEMLRCKDDALQINGVCMAVIQEKNKIKVTVEFPHDHNVFISESV